MEEYILKTEKGDVHYWYSKGRMDLTLVFLHGLSADHRLFDRQIRYFEKEYSCLVWDAPAHGLSRPYQELNYPDAAKVLKQILDLHEIRRPVLIGQSMGGYVIQSFLRAYPQRAAAFAAIDSCPYGVNFYSRSDLWWLRQVEWMSMCYPFRLLKKATALQCTRTIRSRKNMEAMLEPYGKKELCHLMGMGYRGFLEENRELEIHCPVLLIAGKEDITGKVKLYNKRWAKEKGYPLRWIRGAAHNSNDDCPEQVNRILEAYIRFIQRHESGVETDRETKEKV